MQNAALKDALDKAHHAIEVFQTQIGDLKATIVDLQGKIGGLGTKIDALNGTIVDLQATIGDLKGEVAGLTKAIADANDRIAALTAQNSDLKAHLAAANVTIADLTKQLADANDKIDLLSAERSAFFAKLKAALSDQEGVKIVGDRFVFSSAVLFDVGSAEVKPAGKLTIQKVADVVKALAGDEKLKSVHWILQVNGHTDKQKIIHSSKFADNWELSTARALSVVRLLVDDGVEPVHLAAAGFGEFQPMAEGDNEGAYQQNRRIEFKLTDDGPLLKGL